MRSIEDLGRLSYKITTVPETRSVNTVAASFFSKAARKIDRIFDRRRSDAYNLVKLHFPLRLGQSTIDIVRVFGALSEIFSYRSSIITEHRFPSFVSDSNISLPTRERFSVASRETWRARNVNGVSRSVRTPKIRQCGAWKRAAVRARATPCQPTTLPRMYTNGTAPLDVHERTLSCFGASAPVPPAIDRTPSRSDTGNGPVARARTCARTLTFVGSHRCTRYPRDDRQRDRGAGQLIANVVSRTSPIPSLSL